MDKRFLLQAQELSHQKPEYLETAVCCGEWSNRCPSRASP